ncbi:PEGA domain-containing protein [Candidatus Kuenenbacteria bacterium]|nr:PEGA domain-containing protein [Candidatus Kuenenbacteria bacterium]
MKLGTRYIILFIFFTTFLISSVILLKYASGYRYNFKKNIWQKTGVLILESNPKGADIFLNGELQKEKTPAKIMNLFPGNYSVKLQKSNSFDWQKKLTINPNLTTFTKDIILFKKNSTPALSLDQDIEYFKLFSNEKKIIYFIKDKTKLDLWFFNFETKEEKFLNSFAFTKINNFSFSPSEKNVLVEGNDNLGKTNYLILNLEKPEEIVFLNEFAPNIQNIKWDLKSDKILYGTTKIKNESALIQINLKDKKTIPIILSTTDILDYYFDKKFIYYLTLNLENKNVDLKSINLKTNLESKTIYELHIPLVHHSLDKKISENDFNSLIEIEKKITQLPLSSYFFISSSPTGILTILDKKNQLLYLISPQFKIQPETQKIILEAKDATWSKDQKKMLYYNDLELWICYLNQEKLKESYHELLGRWSQKISKAIWHPQENYIIISSDSIKAIEIDGRDQRNVTQLLESIPSAFVKTMADKPTGEKNLFFSSKNKILYFIKDKKLYEMKIY